MRREENKRENKKNKGFTLVELIIVIAILAVIAAIAVPNLVGSIGNARRTADVANAKVIADAVVLTMIEQPEHEKVVLTLDLLETVDSPTTDKQKFINAIILKLQVVPVPKAETDNVFLVSVTVEGIVTVVTSSAAGTAGVELYPTPTGDYEN